MRDKERFTNTCGIVVGTILLFLFSSTPIRQFVRKFPAVSENTRAALAWRGEEIRLLGEGGANKGGARPGKVGLRWRGEAKK